MQWTSKEVRNKWLDFFKKKDHLEVESKSLIPINDNSLLWINSGVATLKNYFSGKENPPHPNLTNSQKCIRTNDIFNVGNTSRHQTFFEMLGNFSIGGYFKETAIELAFKLLTNEFKLDVNKLYITVFEDDCISYDKWIKLGIDEKHIVRCGRDRNFWDVGSGPCGPCTEIYYDRGLKYDPNNIGEKLFFEDIENDRYVEIWNIVFSEFNNDGKNNYSPLVRKNIDTGAGLERLCCILQDVPTNFDTDLFIETIKELEQFSEFKYKVDAYFTNNEIDKKINKAYKVIADHARTLVMAIADGAIPSNKERGYILRRLLRRLIIKQHYTLNITKNMFSNIVNSVVKTMSCYYPYLENEKERITHILDNEYTIFQKTLNQGFKLFNECIKSNTLDKNTTFKLVETYGFPIELIQELADERSITIDIDGFNELFKRHQNISNARKNVINLEQQNESLLKLDVESKFHYDTMSISDARVVKLYNENFEDVDKLTNSGWVVFDNTCFYATSGGQLHDIGTINKSIIVDDVIKGPNLQHIHHISNVDNLKLNQICELEIENKKRELVTKNHSVEHLLHISLVNVIDKSIKQEGAFKSPEKVTFDFNYHKKITDEDIKKIEDEVNKIINSKIDSQTLFLELDEAKQMGAMAYFEDVYKKIKGKLRVIKFGDVSIELCGGTHVKNTGDIEAFKIIDCYQKGAGSWRIEAITSHETINNYNDSLNEELTNKVNEITNFIDSNKISGYWYDDIIKKIQHFLSNNDVDYKLKMYKEIDYKFKEIKNEYNKQQKDKQISEIKSTIKNTKDEGGFIFIGFNSYDNKNITSALSDTINEIIDKIIILVNYIDGKTQYFICVNEDFAKTNNINLNQYINTINTAFSGRGGGKKCFVQGGCNDIIDLSNIKKVVLNA